MSRSEARLALLVGVFWALLLGGCGDTRAAGRDDGKLVITGSSTIAPLMVEIAKSYEREHPGKRVDVQTGGSSRGIADVRQELADLGMVSRALTDAESDLLGFTVALDGIGIITHADNPTRAITSDQVRALFRGEERTWGGDSDRPVTVVHKAEGRSTLEVFLSYFELQNDEIHASVIVGDNEQGIKTVAGNPDAIGYVSIGTAEVAIENGARIRLLELDGNAAGSSGVSAGTYPLSRELNLVTREQPRGSLRAFLDYARSEAVHGLVRRQSFVPVAH